MEPMEKIAPDFFENEDLTCSECQKKPDWICSNPYVQDDYLCKDCWDGDAEYASYLEWCEGVTMDEEDADAMKKINAAAMITEADVQECFNCQEAFIDTDGEIWIEGPMTGHWLNFEEHQSLAGFITTRLGR